VATSAFRSFRSIRNRRSSPSGFESCAYLSVKCRLVFEFGYKSKGYRASVDSCCMSTFKLRLIGILFGLASSLFAAPGAHATCFGSQSQLTCHDNLTGNIYNSRTYRPPVTSLPRVKKRFGWMPMQSHKKLGSLTIVEGYTAGRKRWKTYGRSYRNGDYRIIGSDSRGPVQRTCINGKCF